MAAHGSPWRRARLYCTGGPAKILRNLSSQNSFLWGCCPSPALPLLQADLVPLVRLVLLAARPDPLAAADVIFGEVDPLVVPGEVEDEELELRAEVRGVG